jgi:tetratricopeptide (TPR) repeat protein
VIALVVLSAIAFFIYRGQRKEKLETAIATAVATVAEADKLAAREDWYAALDSLRAVPAAYPQRDSLALKRGRANAALANVDDAIKDFTEALVLNPSLSGAILERAEVYTAQGRDSLALVDYEAVLRLEPRNPKALFGRGGARLRLGGSKDSSLADFTASFEADSTRTDALFARGTLNESLRRNEDAIRDFREILEHSNDPRFREGAEARLRVLTAGSEAPRDTAAAHVSRTVVILHYTDRRDSSAAMQVGAAMRRNGFNVRGARFEPDSQRTSAAELRFPEGSDRDAKNAIVVAEAALARAGYPVRLTPRPIRRTSTAGAGQLHLWLPPLASSLYSVRQSSAYEKK